MPYIPNVDGTTVRTLADWGSFFKTNGKPQDIIELVDMENSILDDIMWREASDKDGHRTAVRTGLPQVYWRQLYKGTPVSKSEITVIKDPVGMLEARSVIDAKLLQLHQSQAQAYRFQEAKAFMEAMRQELSTAIFYGDIKTKPLGIHGLAPRYAYRDAPHVVDAGGTGSENTSIWGVIWGENDVTGIFPHDSPAGLRHEDLGRCDVSDEDGNEFLAYKDLFEWNVGLSTRDWRSVVRVANIPVANLTKSKGETGFVDLHRLTIMAKNQIPPEKRARLKWYVNQEVMTALELQASDAGNVHLHYGDLFRSKGVPFLHGAPVRQNDAILTAEERLPLAA